MARTEPPNRYATLTIILGIASLALLIGSIFMLQLLSVAYGAVAGALVTSGSSNAIVASIAGSPTNLYALFNSILLQYVVVLISLVMLISAVFLYRYKMSIFGTDAKGYITLHGTLAVIYILLYFINLNNSTLPIQTINQVYLYIVYIAMALCIVIDLYVIVSRYLIASRAPTGRGELAMDPSRPYTNLLRIKDTIFSQLSGKISVVDKHMNSIGLENFHRLVQDNFNSLSEINILTSKEMLDAEFSQNYLDCKSEAENNGVRFNVLIMTDSDSQAQHERFVFDNRNAYKVPPFNIIHKKSEHITRLKLPEVKRRFDELYKRSIKYENYVSKNGRPK
jgi:hypothetical protein